MEVKDVFLVSTVIRDLIGEWNCYVLILEVCGLIDIVTRKRLPIIEPGVYFYVGSSRKPCNALARIARHLSRSKPVWWHIDALTRSKLVKIPGVILLPHANVDLDCESKVSELFNKKGLAYIPGFGSSDKPGDISHLFKCGKTSLLECSRDIYEELENTGFNPVYVEVEHYQCFS